jgi:hypothetical protein
LAVTVLLAANELPEFAAASKGVTGPPNAFDGLNITEPHRTVVIATTAAFDDIPKR